MQRSLIIVIVIIVLALTAGVAAFTMTRDDDSVVPANTTTTEQASDLPSGTDTSDDEPTTSASSSNEQHLRGANIGETIDATSQSAVSVDIDDFIFNPTTLKVKKGTTVTWTNKGAVQHDVTSTTTSPKQGLSSDMLSNGESYSFTFDETGVYQYFCSPHPTQMRGVVEVVE